MGSWVTLAQSFAPQASVSQETRGEARVVGNLGQRDLPEEVRVGCWVDGGRATGRMGSPVLQACARPGGHCWLVSSHKPRSGGQYPPRPHAAHRWKRAGEARRQPQAAPGVTGQAGTVPKSRCGEHRSWERSPGTQSGACKPFQLPTPPLGPLASALSCLPAHLGLRLGGGGRVSGGQVSPEVPQA